MLLYAVKVLRMHVAAVAGTFIVPLQAHRGGVRRDRGQEGQEPAAERERH